MSEADRVFPRQEQGAQTLPGEKRLILSAPRRSGSGSGKSRVVEVVHVQRGRSRPTEEQPRPAPWTLRAATWPDGFRAKSALPLPPDDIQPVAPELTQPTVHVMPMWEPSPRQPAPQAAAGTAVAGPRRPRIPKPQAPKVAARHFADPFVDDDSGANCIRCGYLVEQAREKRGLMTCSKCG
jgi:hypothetical protein